MRSRKGYLQVVGKEIEINLFDLNLNEFYNYALNILSEIFNFRNDSPTSYY